MDIYIFSMCRIFEKSSNTLHSAKMEKFGLKWLVFNGD